MPNTIKALAELIRRRRNTKATIDALQRMTDSELKDIGVNRGNISDIANGILDVHRTVRGAKP